MLRAFVGGRDVFAALPGPPSGVFVLCSFAHVFDCLKEKHGPMVICVSPLTSLVMDQTENFSRTNLQMEFVGEAHCDPNAVRRGFYYCRLVRE